MLLDDASACDTFEPSAISCEQFFAEPNEDDEEDEDDDEDDEEDDDEEDDELVVDPSESAVVVGGAEDLLLPQPAAATARTTIGTMAKMRLMLELPLSALVRTYWFGRAWSTS